MRSEISVVACVGVALLMGTSQTVALNCTKAVGNVEKTICAAPELKKADDAMSAAFFKLLRETKDPEFHEALIFSQRRWIETRGRGPDRFGAAEDDKTDDRDILLKITRERWEELRDSTLIRKLEGQRKEASKDSGGPFAGYEAGCGIDPPPYGNWSIQCLGVHRRQNGDRICSADYAWMSGHITVLRRVIELRDGKVHTIASCEIGYDDTGAQCPGTWGAQVKGADARWDMTAETGDWLRPSWPEAGKLRKYDADIDLRSDAPEWMSECLTAPVFPPLDQRGLSKAGGH